MPSKRSEEGPKDADGGSHLDPDAPDAPPDDLSSDGDHFTQRESDIPEEDEGQKGPDGGVEDADGVDLPDLGDYSSGHSSAGCEMEEYYPINLSSWARDVDHNTKEREQTEQEWVRDAEEAILKANQEQLYELVARQISQGHVTT